MLPYFRREAARYFNSVLTPEVTKIFDAADAELDKELTPAFIAREFEFSWSNDRMTSEILNLSSHHLHKALKNCSRGIIMVCTLGLGVDQLLIRSAHQSVLLAAAIQAVAAAMLEKYCDDIEMELLRSLPAAHFTPRFSPGYGDLALIETQKQIFSALRVPETIGVRLTEGCQMVPTKSVSAIMGIVEE